MDGTVLISLLSNGGDQQIAEKSVTMDSPLARKLVMTMTSFLEIFTGGARKIAGAKLKDGTAQRKMALLMCAKKFAGMDFELA